jgi:hypothetical protein
MNTVPRLFPGQAVVVVATGPSLVQEDVDLCRGVCPVIVVNDAYRMAPWADVMYACDGKFWNWQMRFHAKELQAFQGRKFSMATVPGVVRLRNTGVSGLELDPTGLRNGRNSGYQAINLAVHLGAKIILLLGFDMSLGARGRSHFFGEHPGGKQYPGDPHGQTPPFTVFRKHFRALAQPLRDANVHVLNCSRRSALTMFPKVPLSNALMKIQARTGMVA